LETDIELLETIFLLCREDSEPDTLDEIIDEDLAVFMCTHFRSAVRDVGLYRFTKRDDGPKRADETFISARNKLAEELLWRGMVDEYEYVIDLDRLPRIKPKSALCQITEENADLLRDAGYDSFVVLEVSELLTRLAVFWYDYKLRRNAEKQYIH